jgi:large subunit ribosomal protein L29
VTKARELRELGDQALAERLVELKRELLELRFAIATGQGTQTARLGELCRDIARIETIRRQRELAASGQGARGRKR